MQTHTKRLTASAFLSMLFLGVATTVVGAAARNINLNASEIGVYLAVQQFGFMIAVWVTGALADTYEKPRLLLGGSLILALSFLFFYATGIFWLNLLIMLIICLGIGTYEGVTDPMLLALHARRQSLYININHFFVTFGSILITVYLLFLEMNWRNALVQSAAVVLLLAVLYGTTRLKNNVTHSEAYLKRINILSRERLVVTLFVATALLVGIELGTTGILTTYLMDLRGFTQTTSKLGLLVFLSGIAAGRIIIGFFGRMEHLTQTILALFGFATLTFAALFLVDLGDWSYLIIFLAGLSISALLPLMITLAGVVYPEMAGTVIGSIKVAIPLGGILVPLLLSFMAARWSLQVALLIFPLAALAALLVLIAGFRSIPDAIRPSD